MCPHAVQHQEHRLHQQQVVLRLRWCETANRALRTALIGRPLPAWGPKHSPSVATCPPYRCREQLVLKILEVGHMARLRLAALLGSSRLQCCCWTMQRSAAVRNWYGEHWKVSESPNVTPLLKLTRPGGTVQRTRARQLGCSPPCTRQSVVRSRPISIVHLLITFVL